MTITWHAVPPRQLTGKPRQYHGYVSTHPRVMRNGRLCHQGHHYSGATARACAERTARRLNRQGVTA